MPLEKHCPANVASQVLAARAGQQGPGSVANGSKASAAFIGLAPSKVRRRAGLSFTGEELGWVLMGQCNRVAVWLSFLSPLSVGLGMDATAEAKTETKRPRSARNGCKILLRAPLAVLLAGTDLTLCPSCPCPCPQAMLATNKAQLAAQDTAAGSTLQVGAGKRIYI